MKPIKTLILLLLLAVSITLFSGCSQDSYDFLCFEEDDVYTCTVNDNVSFWVSPVDMYGEWTKGETVIPIKMRWSENSTPRVCSHYAVDFYDEYGCRIGYLALCMSDGYFKEDTTAKYSLCMKLEELKVLNTDYQEFLNEQIADITWEGVVIKKEKKDVDAKNTAFYPLEKWSQTEEIDEVLICEDGGFWFSLSSGKGYWQNNPATEDALSFEITASTPYPHIYYRKAYYLGPAADCYYSAPCIKLYMCDDSNKEVLNSYEIFADEEGYYIWLETEGDPIKARLTKTTSDTAPYGAGDFSENKFF